MSKKRLGKAPLVLVQAQFCFSDLPSRTLGTEQELEVLHKAMSKIGFAERIDAEVVEFSFQLNQEAHEGYIQPKQQKNDLNRLVFRGFGQRQSVELIRNRLTIRSAQYDCYEKFSESVKTILGIFTTTLSDLENVLVKQASIRYIDVILPSKDHVAKDYICPTLLPYHLKIAEEAFGMSQSIAKTGNNRFMVITAEEVQVSQTGGYPGRWLPIDLLESDHRAALILNPYLDNYEPGKNYVILNIDHRVDFPEMPMWKPQETLNQLNSLYELSSQFFWDVITDTAKKEWEVINES